MQRLILVHDSADISPIVPVGVLTLAAISTAAGIRTEVTRLPKRSEENAFLSRAAGADVVGFSTVCSNYPRVLLLAKQLKTASPHTLIVLGGPQATVTAFETVRRFSQVDLVIRGEAETAWTLLLEQAKQSTWDWSKIPGAVWHSAQGVEETPQLPTIKDLDLVPMPLFEDYEPMRRRQGAMIEVGRGCPYHCTFCVTNLFFCRDFRMKSPQRILAEMDKLNACFGIRLFDFIHDMFTVRHEFVRELCQELKQRDYRWGCSSRTERLNPELLQEMYAAGCRGFFFGIETGSPRLQDLIQKGLDIFEAVQTVRLVRRMGFLATVSVIMGFPQETRADLRDTLLLIAELMTDPGIELQVPLFSPFTGSPIIDEGYRYSFDGLASNSVVGDGQATPAELELIASSFHLFSAFYYPADTEYARQDYLALQILLEDLNQVPTLKRFLLEAERVGLVDYLLEGGFGVDIYHLPRQQVREELLLGYAVRSTRGQTIRELLAFEKTRSDIQRSPIGTYSICQVGPDAINLVIPGGLVTHHPEARDSYLVMVVHSSDGLAGQVIWPERTPAWVYNPSPASQAG